MELRNPNKGHYPEIVALLQRCFETAWEPQALADRVYYEPHYDPNHVWMAREAGQVLGFMVCTLDGERAWIKLLAVAPEARRRGIASDLVSRAEFRLSGEGARRLSVESTPPYEFLAGVEPGGEAEAFFRARGFEASEFDVVLVNPGLFSTGRAFDRQAAAAFGREHAGQAWPWVEETLGYQPPRVIFEPDAGLALAEPGQSLGPIWPAPGASPSAERMLFDQALAIASSGRRKDARGLRFWEIPGSLKLPDDPAFNAQHEKVLHFHKTLA